MAGVTLRNDTNHSVKRGSATTAIGFCFFTEDPEDAKHRLAGIVDFDQCITVEVPDDAVMKCQGRYADFYEKWEIVGGKYYPEYCTTHYCKDTFRLISHTDKYKKQYPNHSDLHRMFPELFI